MVSGQLILQQQIIENTTSVEQEDLEEKQDNIVKLENADLQANHVTVEQTEEIGAILQPDLALEL